MTSADIVAVGGFVVLFLLMARGQGTLDSFEPVDTGRKADDVEG